MVVNGQKPLKQNIAKRDTSSTCVGLTPQTMNAITNQTSHFILKDKCVHVPCIDNNVWIITLHPSHTFMRNNKIFNF